MLQQHAQSGHMSDTHVHNNQFVIHAMLCDEAQHDPELGLVFGVGPMVMQL